MRSRISHTNHRDRAVRFVTVDGIKYVCLQCRVCKKARKKEFENPLRHAIKPLNEFYAKSSYCKPCAIQKATAYQEAHSKKYKEIRHEYYLRHKEKKLAYNKSYWARNHLAINARRRAKKAEKRNQ